MDYGFRKKKFLYSFYRTSATRVSDLLVSSSGFDMKINSYMRVYIYIHEYSTSLFLVGVEYK